MSQSTTEKWTTEDVHHWLMTEVKVHQSCADIFTEGEVSGDCLVTFKKTDLLDLGIKHGPAVKITSYLDSLKEGSKYKSQFPAYVEKWSKQQVSQWLLQHVKIYNKYAERLQKEDVSGDCLVCFRKQDFLDLDVKSGPAVKIVAQLDQLKTKPVLTLQPTLQTSTDQRNTETCVQPERSLAQPSTSQQPDLQNKTEPHSASEKAPLPVRRAPPETTLPIKEQSTRPQRGAAATKLQQGLHQITVEIHHVLEELRTEDLKRFHFHLKGYTNSKQTSIPWGKLEDKDTVDTAKLMTDHYGSEEASRVATDILKEINQRELACQFERTKGQLQQQSLSKEDVKKEDNQGDKLKTLLTCGGNTLDNYDRFIVVVNKSSPEQVQYLQFLSKLKLFCVLDFDPNSTTSGVCHTYKELRVANLHTPSQFQGQTESVIRSLNLYKQTSWVFCNGRNDLDSDSHQELDYKTWLRKSCRDVEQLVSFICNPEVLPQGKCLIMFLLLSPVDTEKDPVFETYMSFIKHTEETNIITICDSQSTYLKWRELIQEKCDYDIEHLSINALTLSEINGTIMALGPNNQSGRQLPSSGSSTVVLKQKDEDLLTALDVLCMNQCENIFDENSSEFHDFRIETEEKFFRGGKAEWWNFYFCDKEKPFIKRDKYENVKKMITSPWRDSNNVCELLNLFHHAGCGGTTLAMHVMWDLRKKFRCAVLKDNTLPKTEVASQVLKLMKLESEKASPVLLLVDDSKDSEDPYDLENCIRKAVEDNAPNCKVIILNCVRSHSPKKQYQQQNTGLCQFMTASLTPDEQKDFDKKLDELKESHEKPENFYSFMIMKSNFDKKYTADLARNTLENFDFSTKEAQLFAFLALLNTYVAESAITLSLCEDLFGMKMVRWQKDSVLERMNPYSNLLIINPVDDWGGYKGVQILHHTIASACLDELEGSYSLKVSDIAKEMLHFDLFFGVGVVKHQLMISIQQMLIRRLRKKDGDGRELFSPLIDKIHNQQGKQTVQEVFVKASSRFETSASIPQALARYLYIEGRDYPEAVKWAEKAKNIKENPYNFDTIGQVYKSNMKSNIEREKKEASHNPEDLLTNIQIAVNGMKAFQRAQELAELEDEPQENAADDKSEDFPRTSYTVYGYVNMLEMAFLVFEILGSLPFFDVCNPMKKRYLQSFLKGTMPITSVYKENTEINDRYVEIIKEHEQFLVRLKSKVKETLDLLDCYFAYIKGNSEFDATNHRTVSEHFKKYVHLFCNTPEERKQEQETKSNLNLKLDIEERRLYLEMNQADTFSGILQHLDKPAEEMEKIIEYYVFLQKETNVNQNIQLKINYILSNIILYQAKPNSKYLKKYQDLCTLLLETLQNVGFWHPSPDPYYLALLLMWPNPAEENKEISKYVTAIRKSSHKHLSKLFHKRSTVACFYLGKEKGLKRLVSKPTLDKSFLPKMSRHTLAQLWRNGDIFKEKAIINCLHRVSGTIEQDEVYANNGKQKILVRPARPIRSGFSTEIVSFYLGFAINGPLAYDIQYEN
ncbi:sterile alpha motif domain-containing protein 9 [Brachyistius frenatus]|uniref:sterile alpha motif domain-containing protein 9 n=1 Tax=Brachyistius frenatus TaxID=100188 RepID=UPI0037E9C05B